MLHKFRKEKRKRKESMEFNFKFVKLVQTTSNESQIQSPAILFCGLYASA